MQKTDFLSATQAAKIEPAVHPNTIRNWMVAGCDGVRLRCEVVGGRFFTTAKWLAEFRAARRRAVIGLEAAAPEQAVDEAAALAAHRVHVGG